VLDQLANGILFGAIIAMTSVGLSLIFNVAGAFNFAHGDLVTLGSMMAVLFATTVGLPVWLSIVLAVVAGGAAGLLLDFTVFRPLRRAGAGGITLLVTTLGLALIIRYAILAVAGPEAKALPLPPQHVTPYFGLRFTPLALVVIVSTIVILIAFGILLAKSRLGVAMRAVASNGTLAAASGVDIERIITITWVLGGALAATGGVMLALTQLVYWDMGFQLLLLMFAGIIVGGLGSPFGAMLGGFVIGLIAQLAVTLPYVREHNDLKISVALLVLVAVLLLRPQGILGRKARLS